MALDEELDLDTLAELLDEDDFNDENIVSTNSANDSVKPCDQIKQTTFTPISKESPVTSVNHQKRILKDVSVDIFSAEPSTSGSSTNENSKLTKLKKDSTFHSGETDSSDDEERKTFLTETGKMIKKKMNVFSPYNKPEPKVIKTWKNEELQVKPTDRFSKESFFTESYSGIRIVNPLVPHSTLESRMNGRRMIKMSFIRNFMRNGDIEGDWVTIGVVASKVPPKTSKNGKTYSIWKMTDLYESCKFVSVFLFGNVHSEHWKTAVGTVFGILNPSIMPEKEKNGDISLSVDHPGKFMMLGTAKDFGHCKARRKDGAPCTAVVNMSLCEFCSYHVSKEYRKASSKRTELQASYSGRQPSLKSKVLKGQNVMYGGQMFSSPNVQKPAKVHSKDKLTLNNLGLKRKAEQIVREETSKCIKSSPNGLPATAGLKVFSPKSQFIQEQLSIPSAGSRNLYQHLVKKEIAATDDQKKMVSITPKELLKMHEKQLKERKALAEMSVANLSPQLGRGIQPGDEINLDALARIPKKAFTTQDVAKLKAINHIKEKGPLQRKNPNAVKNAKSPEAINKVKKALETNISENIDSVENTKPSSVLSGLLGTIDLNSEKVKEILNRKSSHSYEIEADEIEKLELYFRNLEKKEQMEAKMATITEIVCDVTSCKVCKYTAQQATDFCKNENHPLRCHKAVKRFFVCNKCRHRTCAFTKFPTKSCRQCGESSFSRTTMLRPRSGPKLENENLCIRGDEIKFLNSLKS